MSVVSRLALGTAVLGATLVLHAQAPAAQPIPKGTNVLLGRVVEMGADSPISGAIVTLFGFFDAAGKPVARIPQGLAGASDGRSILTTADGYFVFRDLPAGRYTVGVRALGFAAISSSQVIEISDNEKPAPIPVRLWRYASIGGRVVDERGEPVVGMIVNALRRSTSGGRVVMSRAGSSVASVGITDDRGVYRIAELTPGDYAVGVLSTTTTMPVSVAGAMEPSAANVDAYSDMSLQLRGGGLSRTWGCEECWASSSDGHRFGNLVLQRLGPTMPLAPGGQPLGFASSLYPGTSSVRDATLITLGSGESRTGIDVPIRFVPTVSVSGVVTGPDGPMKHQVVRLVPPGVSLSDFDPSGIAIAVSDAQGVFTILGVTPGDYALSATFMELSQMGGVGRALSAVQPLAVGDSDITDLKLIVESGAKVSGRVAFKTQSASRPTQSMQVTLGAIDPLFSRTFPALVQSDDTFRSIGHPPGRYTINATPPTGWFWQSTTLGGKPLADEIIPLGSSELTGLVITFGQATNGVFGTVTDANGLPDADALVVAFAADSTAAWRDGIFSTRRVRGMWATSKGAYEMATLAAGEYFITAVVSRTPINLRDPQVLERLIAGATRITLGAEDSKNIALKSVVWAGK